MTQRREVERVWQRELQLVDHTQQIGVATREIRGVPQLALLANRRDPESVGLQEGNNGLERGQQRNEQNDRSSLQVTPQHKCHVGVGQRALERAGDVVRQRGLETRVVDLGELGDQLLLLLRERSALPTRNPERRCQQRLIHQCGQLLVHRSVLTHLLLLQKLHHEHGVVGVSLQRLLQHGVVLARQTVHRNGVEIVRCIVVDT